MKFYFCQSCGKRLTETDISEGKARDKKLKGVYCNDCAVGVFTIEDLPLSDDEARKLVAEEVRARSGTPEEGVKGVMRFYYCESCNKRLTESDIRKGEGKDKRQRGIFCTQCGIGVTTVEFSSLTQDEARKLVDADNTGTTRKAPREGSTARRHRRRTSSLMKTPSARRDTEARRDASDKMVAAPGGPGSSRWIAILAVVVGVAAALLLAIGLILGFGEKPRERSSKGKRKGRPVSEPEVAVDAVRENANKLREGVAEAPESPATQAAASPSAPEKRKEVAPTAVSAIKSVGAASEKGTGAAKLQRSDDAAARSSPPKDEPMSVAALPAEAAKPDPHVLMIQARTAYVRFTDVFLPHLRNADATEAEAVWRKAQSGPALEPLKEQLARHRLALAWLKEGAQLKRNGAESLKQVDDFQIHGTSGKPMNVGRKQDFQVKRVTGEAIFVGNKNVDMPFPWTRVSTRTRSALIERALGRDADGLAHRMFLRLLALGANGEKVRTDEVAAGITRAEKAGAPEETVAYLKELHGLAAKGAREMAAERCWEGVQAWATAGKWKAVRDGIQSLMRDFAETRWVKSNSDELEKLKAKAKEEVALAEGHHYDFDTPASYARFVEDVTVGKKGRSVEKVGNVVGLQSHDDGQLSIKFEINGKTDTGNWVEDIIDWTHKTATWKGDWEIRFKVRWGGESYKGSLTQLSLYFERVGSSPSGCFVRIAGQYMYGGFGIRRQIWLSSKKNIFGGKRYTSSLGQFSEPWEIIWVKKGSRIDCYVNDKRFYGGEAPSDFLERTATNPVRLGILVFDPTLKPAVDHIYFGPIRYTPKEEK